MDRNISQIKKDVRSFNHDLGRQHNPYPILSQRRPFDSLTQAELKLLFDYDPLTGKLMRKETSTNAIRSGASFGGKLYVIVGTTRHAAEKVIWLWLHGERKKKIGFRNGNKRDFRAENLFVA
jgi:hypothetical protein